MAIRIVLLLVGLGALVFAMPPAVQDTAAVDSVKPPMPDYTDVNVIVETDWGTTDKTEKVDVFIRKGSARYTEVVMKKSDHQECIIELVPGMVVKIISRKSGKVLKTFKP